MSDTARRNAVHSVVPSSPPPPSAFPVRVTRGSARDAARPARGVLVVHAPPRVSPPERGGGGGGWWAVHRAGRLSRNPPRPPPPPPGGEGGGGGGVGA